MWIKCREYEELKKVRSKYVDVMKAIHNAENEAVTHLPTSATRCDCIACQNRCTETTYIVSNRTLTKKEIEEQLKKKYENDWNYGRGD